jgi:adenylate cyclase
MSLSGTRRGYLTPLLAPIGVLGILFAVSETKLSQQLENVTVDWRYNAREPHDPPADPRILLVGIGEYSLKEVGRWEEWTREVHALFLEQLSWRQPAVVAYDFLFSENSREQPLHDKAFADKLSLFPGSVTGAFVDVTDHGKAGDKVESIGNTRPIERFVGNYEMLERGETGALPIPPVAESSWTGFVNSPPSRIDGVRRKVPLVVGYGGKVWPSLVLQMLIQLDGAAIDGVEVVLGDAVTIHPQEGEARRIPIDDRGFLLLNYRGKQAFAPVDYIELMQKLHEFGPTGSWPESLPPIDGRILLIGQMAEGLTDFGRTPYSPQEPLVHVQAVALNTILQSDYLKILPLWQVLAGWLPLAWITLFYLRKSRVSLAAVAPVLLVTAYVGIAYYLFRSRSLQLPLFLPVLGFLLVHGGALIDRLVLEMRAKSRIKNLFGTYAPQQVVEAMIASGDDPKLGGQEMEITAFFSDIQGFSTFSEQLAPEPLVTLMNDYLSAMTEVLFQHDGTLDKYIGDAIVGMYGAPLPFADHAYRACASTIEMHRQLVELREKWRREGGWPEIVYQMQTRIGLNTGPAVIGNMGSPRRFNYTMMGDTVNLAARCESGAKSYGVYTMVTGETRAASMGAKDDIAFRYLDKTVVKGRTQPVEMYEVLGFVSELSSEACGCIEIYSAGIEKYLARDWDGAAAAFESSSRLERFQPGVHPGVHDNPSLIMIGRCAEMKADPPGEDWDGRYVMKTK